MCVQLLRGYGIDYYQAAAAPSEGASSTGLVQAQDKAVSLVHNTTALGVQVLKGHHSRDHSFLQKILAAMDSHQPWRCMHCKKMRAASAEFCASCGTAWQDAIDRNYVHQPHATPWRTGGWDYTDWNPNNASWPKKSGQETPRSTSPRAPRHPKAKAKHPAHQKGKEKGAGKGKQTGKGKSKDKSSNANQAERFAPPHEAPWKPQQLDSTAASSAAGSQQDPKIQQLLGAMQKQSGTFSPEIQSMLQEVTTQTSQQATKELHMQVTRLGNAKKQLQIALDARKVLYHSWQDYSC